MENAIIIGQGYTGRLGIARSVAMAGCDVTLIIIVPQLTRKYMRKPVDAYSKYVKKYYFTPNHDDQALVNLLLDRCKAPDHKPLIIPDSDFSEAAVDRNLELLEEYFVCPHIAHTAGAAVLWMDKTRQKALAKEVGLNVANSTVVNLAEDSFHLPESIVFPCFSKPLMSEECGKIGLGRCESEEELRDHLALMKKGGAKLALVEDFKKIDAEYALVGFSDGTNIHIPGLLELLRVSHGYHLGVAVQGRIFPNACYEELVIKFKEFIRRIGFVGLFDIDFYRSGGVFFFGEMNLRFGGSGYAYTKMGVNLPAIMVDCMRKGIVVEETPLVQSEAVYMNERMAVDDWYYGFISLKEYRDLYRESDFSFIRDSEDPCPWRVFQCHYMKLRAYKIVKRWLKKRS